MRVDMSYGFLLGNPTRAPVYWLSKKGEWRIKNDEWRMMKGGDESKVDSRRSKASKRSTLIAEGRRGTSKDDGREGLKPRTGVDFR